MVFVPLPDVGRLQDDGGALDVRPCSRIRNGFPYARHARRSDRVRGRRPRHGPSWPTRTLPRDWSMMKRDIDTGRMICLLIAASLRTDRVSTTGTVRAVIATVPIDPRRGPLRFGSALEVTSSAEPLQTVARLDPCGCPFVPHRAPPSRAPRQAPASLIAGPGSFACPCRLSPGDAARRCPWSPIVMVMDDAGAGWRCRGGDG